MEARMAQELGLRFTHHELKKIVYKVGPKIEDVARAGTAE